MMTDVLAVWACVRPLQRCSINERSFHIPAICRFFDILGVSRGDQCDYSLELTLAGQLRPYLIERIGAGDGDRTRDVQLGKLAFYR